MNSSEIEYFMARLYTESDLVKRFVTDARATLAEEKLSLESAKWLLTIDLQELQLAFGSYQHKRQQHQKPRSWLSMLQRRLIQSLNR